MTDTDVDLWPVKIRHRFDLADQLIETGRGLVALADLRAARDRAAWVLGLHPQSARLRQLSDAQERLWTLLARSANLTKADTPVGPSVFGQLARESRWEGGVFEGDALAWFDLVDNGIGALTPGGYALMLTCMGASDTSSAMNTFTTLDPERSGVLTRERYAALAWEFYQVRGPSTGAAVYGDLEGR